MGRASKGFLDPVPERNSDSPRLQTRNWILSDYHTISRMIDFFDSIDPMQTKTAAIMGDGRVGGGTEVPAASADRGPI